MSKIVGTIATVKQFLSKQEVVLLVKPGQPSEDKIVLISDRKYEIPLFQREVRWETGNVNVLLSDLLHGARFLGNIILSIRQDGTCEIIDGQQRTTVLMMILACVKEKYGDAIELFDCCPLKNMSFPRFQEVVAAGFNSSSFPAEEWKSIINGDAYKQFPRIRKLWNSLCASEILCDRYQAKKVIDNLKESELNIIASHSGSEDSSIRYFLDVNLKGVQLDTEDIFKGYLFSQDSREETRKLWQDIKQLSIKFNAYKNGEEDKRYPLMKVYEHFFYCDLFLSNPGGQDFNGMKFGENFLLSSQFNVGSNRFFEGTHIIEVICNSAYFKTSLEKINKALEIMCDIVQSNEGPSDNFKKLFNCDSSLNYVHIKNCHIMLQKILLDKEIIPKVLALKYILMCFDGQMHDENLYKSIYSVYTASVIFTIFAPKKESETFYGFVRSHNMVADMNKWLVGYITSHDLTRGKLSAAYKCSEVTDEDEITESVRCKSLAAIYNYITVTEDTGESVLRVSNYKELNSFLCNKEKYSVEHFIIGEKGKLKVKTEKFDFMYSYPSTIKKYRNSLFNYIFIPDDINQSLENVVIDKKLEKLEPCMDKVSCGYSKKYLELIRCREKHFAEYPTIEQIDKFNTQEQVETYLTKYYTKIFADEFLLFATDLVKSTSF